MYNQKLCSMVTLYWYTLSMSSSAQVWTINKAQAEEEEKCSRRPYLQSQLSVGLYHFEVVQELSYFQNAQNKS